MTIRDRMNELGSTERRVVGTLGGQSGRSGDGKTGRHGPAVATACTLSEQARYYVELVRHAAHLREYRELDAAKEAALEGRLTELWNELTEDERAEVERTLERAR